MPTDPQPDATPQDGLGRATVLLVALWAAADVVFGATLVLHPAVQAMWLTFLGLLVFVTALNIWLAALVIGLIALHRSRPRRALRSSAFVVLMTAGVVGSFTLGGWALSAPDDETAELTHLTARGVAVWAIAALVVLGSAWLLRVGALNRPAVTRTRRGKTLAAWSLLGALALAALPVWVHVAGGPSVNVVNDSARQVRVQLCPAQECTGQVTRLAPHATTRFSLPAELEELPDSLRVTSDDQVLGCIVLLDGGLAGVRHLEVGVSSADPESC